MSFPVAWQYELQGKTSSSASAGSYTGITTTIDPVTLTSIRFETTAPDGYTTNLGVLSTGIEVWQNASVQTEIAFVFDGTIYAPTSCYYLLGSSTTSERLTKLQTILFNNFDTSKVTDMRAMFYFCTSLTSLDVSNFDTSKVTDMSSMFSGCSKLTSLDVSNFDTSKVTNMRNMFHGCSNLTSLDLSSFDLLAITDASKVDDMLDLAYGSFAPLNEIKLPKNFGTVVTSLSLTAKYSMISTINKPETVVTTGGTASAISNEYAGDTLIRMYKFPTTWQYELQGKTSSSASVGSYTDMTTTIDPVTLTSIRFEKTVPTGYTTKLGILSTGIEVWQNASATTEIAFVSPYTIYAPQNCSLLFSSGSSSNQLTNLQTILFNNFNTVQVTNMSSMFYNCLKLTNLDLSGFNTSLVTNMYLMFYSCVGLTSLDLSNFDTSQVTTLDSMFNSCSGLTEINITSFNTSKVTNIRSMFYHCTNLLSIDLSNFNTSQVTDMSYMFYNCVRLQELNLSSFDTSKVTSVEGMFQNCLRLKNLDLSNFDLSAITSASKVNNMLNFGSTCEIQELKTPKNCPYEITITCKTSDNRLYNVADDTMVTSIPANQATSLTLKRGALVTADANGGVIITTEGWSISEDGLTASKVVYYDSVNITTFPNAELEKHELIGWSDTKTGTANITTETEFITDTTIYAIWQTLNDGSITLTINFADDLINTLSYGVIKITYKNGEVKTYTLALREKTYTLTDLYYGEYTISVIVTKKVNEIEAKQLQFLQLIKT